MVTNPIQIRLQWSVFTIILSIFIAFLGSYACITLYEQYRVCSRMNKSKLASPKALLFNMALSVGGVAIWCMHFVGMSATTLYDPNGNTIPVSFRIDLTIVSLLAVLICTLLGLYLGVSDKSFMMDKRDVVDSFIEDVRRRSLEQIRKIKHKNVVLSNALFRNMTPLVIGGVLIAAGVCVMHYVGMMAMVFDGEMVWDGGIVTASCVIALVASTAALWIMFRLLAMFPDVELLRLGCAVVMALAVNGMHYTGMEAATFVYQQNKPSPEGVALVDIDTAQYGAVIAAVLFLSFVFIISLADLRVWYHNLAKTFIELDNNLLAALSDENRVRREDFYFAYMTLRETDAADKAIQEFRKYASKLSQESHFDANNSKSRRRSQSKASKAYPNIELKQEGGSSKRGLKIVPIEQGIQEEDSNLQDAEELPAPPLGDELV